jgi:hypothetical protein
MPGVGHQAMPGSRDPDAAAMRELATGSVPA